MQTGSEVGFISFLGYLKKFDSGSGHFLKELQALNHSVFGAFLVQWDPDEGLSKSSRDI